MRANNLVRAMRKERKDYTFPRLFDDKPDNTPDRPEAKRNMYITVVHLSNVQSRWLEHSYKAGSIERRPLSCLDPDLVNLLLTLTTSPFTVPKYLLQIAYNR